MNNTNGVLDKARELGNSITQSIEFQALLKAEDDFRNDIELLSLIGVIDKIKATSSQEEYLEDIITLEEEINKSSIMIELNLAKKNYDKLLKDINNIISYITDEESRVLFSTSKSKKGCGSSCGGCSTK